MNESFSSKNPKQRMRELIQQFSDQYGAAYIKCATIKEDEQYLYMADIKIQYKCDDPVIEAIQRYENVTLATISLTLDELEKLIGELDSGKINLKSLGCVNAKNEFDPTYWHVSSRTHYNGYYDDWPNYGFRASLSNEGKPFRNISKPLIKSGLPAYPNFLEACNVFFQHKQYSSQYTPVKIDFLIPNYDARINVLKITEKQISVSIERRKSPLSDLAVQIFCTKTNKKHQHSEDLKFNDTEMVKFNTDFVPDHVFAYLIDSKNNRKLDSKVFGSFYTEETEGIIVKTSVESVEAMLVAGENQHIEFKQNFDKTNMEFLESIVSFANTNDGTILLGVDDDGKVAGFYDDFGKTEKKIKGLISGSCEPDIDTSIEQISLDNRPVIVVKVKKGEDRPYLLSGKSAYKRVKDEDRVFKRLDFDGVLKKKQDAYNKNFRANV